MTEERIDAPLRKWLARLPHPYTPEDRAAGYRYDVSVLQAEFLLTQMLDQPVSGRIFFEQVTRDNLDLGRPDRVQLILARQVRRTTPGRFRTRVIAQHVTPSLYVDYKLTTIKQYHKEGGHSGPRQRSTTPTTSTSVDPANPAKLRAAGRA